MTLGGVSAEPGAVADDTRFLFRRPGSVGWAAGSAEPLVADVAFDDTGR